MKYARSSIFIFVHAYAYLVPLLLATRCRTFLFLCFMPLIYTQNPPRCGGPGSHSNPMYHSMHSTSSFPRPQHAPACRPHARVAEPAHRDGSQRERGQLLPGIHGGKSEEEMKWGGSRSRYCIHTHTHTLTYVDDTVCAPPGRFGAFPPVVRPPVESVEKAARRKEADAERCSGKWVDMVREGRS